MKSDRLLLEAVIKYCDDILSDLSYYGYDEEIFNEENRFQHSCSFCLFQIGEYVKRLSESLKRENPQVDWRGISGLRDVIGHAYNDIRLHSIWTTMTEEVPILREECIKILKEIS
jgi:uncharacterized protein with HEPN domain